MAILFIQCIALMLKLVGRVGSAFLKKYIDIKKGLRLVALLINLILIILF